MKLKVKSAEKRRVAAEVAKLVLAISTTHRLLHYNLLAYHRYTYCLPPATHH